ncbi:DNA repair metallo-beta-lactamase [Novymonas esmeraldas]|uniref:Protein artemis n=1 Tax=Novymonas esmeraldas TaxID=1808958 RepID=A0AAW0ETA3_9TRYP
MDVAARSQATTARGDGALREYLKSREVHRGARGVILVDAFRFVQHGAAVAAPRTLYFLSHFHSDHYTGITNRWHSDTIYCSRPTAALTQSQLGVAASCLFPMDLGRTYIFSLSTGACLECVAETPHHPRVQALLTAPVCAAQRREHDIVAVRLIPANHCPGAVMLLFSSPAFGTVLHTGDFRFNGSREAWQQSLLSPASRRAYVAPLTQPRRRAGQLDSAGVPTVPDYEQFIADDAALQEVARGQLLDVLYLDNTFCAPAYRFPSQWDVTQTVIEALRSLFRRGAAAAPPAHSASPQRRQVRCAVLIGSYTIGKERVALALRDAFPPAQLPTVPHDGEPHRGGGGESPQPSPWRVHVSPSRHAMLSSIGFFADCFAALEAVDDGAVAGAACKPEGGTTTGSTRRTARVDDVAVLLPEQLPHHGASQNGRCDSGAGAHAVASADGGADHLPAAATAVDVEHLLSVVLVSMANVGYRAVAALATGATPDVVDVEDGMALDLHRYDRVLVVEPTGWCKRCTSRDVSDKYTILRVPYSEHCGFHELLQFVKLVNPTRIVPTVSEESFAQHEALFVEQASRLRSRVSNVQPITRFFSVTPVSKAAAAEMVHRDSSTGTVGPLHQAAPLSESSAFPKNCTVPDDTDGSVSGVKSSTAATACAPVAEERKRAHAEGSAAAVAQRLQPARATAPAAAVTTVASNATRTLERFFQKAKLEPATSATADTACNDDDEECQVVRIVQTVVEISDDD